jgi:tRNA-2-methylthio-N6-dimethylallyladenosine synthase
MNRESRMNRSYFIETYGCEMNKAESSAVETLFLGRGWTAAPSGGDADLVLINTCSVRETAETRAKGRIAHYAARKREKGFTLVVTGCMAERAGEGIKDAYPAVDYVVGNFSKGSLASILDAVDSGGRAVIGEDASFVFAPSHLSPGAFRSYLPIMNGCDNFCSYCIVPYVRGRETSRKPSEVISELRALAASGVREATLLGQNVNSYKYAEDGVETDFPVLLKAADAELRKLRDEGIGELRWLRFLSSHPKDFSGPVVEAMAGSPFLCRHLHLCVQHGSDRMLAAMNRRYTRAYYLDLVHRIRSAMPGISLSTDLLTGFPGETEEDLGELFSLMSEVRFEYAFMYHFNPRAGTKAAGLPDQIPAETRKERLARVIALQAEITRGEMSSRTGTECAVLVEGFSRKSREEVLARNQQDEMVVLPGSAHDIGSFVGARLGPLSGNTFRAERMETCPGN